MRFDLGDSGRKFPPNPIQIHSSAATGSGAEGWRFQPKPLIHAASSQFPQDRNRMRRPGTRHQRMNPESQAAMNRLRSPPARHPIPVPHQPRRLPHRISDARSLSNRLRPAQPASAFRAPPEFTSPRCQASTSRTKVTCAHSTRLPPHPPQRKMALLLTRPDNLDL